MTMPRWTLLLAALLVALGLGFWLGTGRQSVTALIPAFLGVPLGACALLSGREGWRAPTMHIAAVLALVGFAGTVGGAVSAVRLLAGAGVERPRAATAQGITALLCLLYLFLAVRSFVLARRRK